MAYFIFKSSDPVTPFVIINEQTVDTVSTSLQLVGKRRIDYGEQQQQNQLWLLENFASPNSPSNPVTGQLWYDTSTNDMKIYQGTQFVKLTNVFSSTNAPQSPTLGQMWFNTSDNTLSIWNGSAWQFIGPTDDPVPYAIIFGS